MNPENNQPVQYNQKPAISSPSKPASSETPAKKSPSKVLLLVLGFVIIIIAVGAYVLGTQKSTSQTAQISLTPTISQPKPTTDPTANWKTYKSRYGYSFTYPSNWGVEDSTGDKGAQIWSRSEYFALREKDPQHFKKEDFAQIDISFYRSGTKTAFGDVSEKTKLATFVANRYGKALLNAEEITLNEESALLVTVQRQVLKKELPLGIQNCPTEEPCFVDDGMTQAIWLKLNGDIGVIDYRYGRKYKQASELQNIFEHFLSTFTFTNATPAVSTSKAKTYTDAKYAFSFAVPGGYFTEVKDYPENDERLVYIKKTDAPIFGYTLTIKPNWDNTGYDPARVKEMTVGGVLAKRIDPPSKEEQDMSPYQMNVYFEHGGRVFVFTCGHNWVPEYVAACNSILEGFAFTK